MVASVHSQAQSNDDDLSSKYSMSKSLSSDNDSLLETSQHERMERRNQRRAQRKAERFQKRQRLLLQEATTRGPFSMVFITLMAGIALSLIDVLYIMRHLDTQHDNSSWSSTNARVKKPTLLNQANVTAMLKAKGPILDLIRDAGISFDPVEDADLLEELPDWADVVKMYGDKPVLYGINEENCQRFQHQSDPGEHMLGVAGTFNSGTNLMAELLIHNCFMPERLKKYGRRNFGIRWQVPWGKHTPPGDEKYRNEHKSKKDWNVNASEIMPAVTIRDPLIWLKSMCKHQYTARWYRPHPEHCPDFSIKQTTTSIKYADFRKRHDSILHHWNDFYQEYLHVNIPFMMVRFEDLVFHPKEVTTAVCQCAGGQMMNKKFSYIVESAKKGIGAHGKVRTGFVDALVRYGTELKRYNGYNEEDLAFVRDNIDNEIMSLMGYSPVDPLKALA
ncbi:hypothetical protein IV203_031184 [Nitzschia inconspicua]|uniref:Sulfotransferase domain-containing protein n=1 Tax=Nitzschia inconspicua TaxID=303405 RepID=A0A9K3Q2E0_9STRA|nr:hypothetical protein IV203_031184 [Nitzschia inconspicua]